MDKKLKRKWCAVLRGGTWSQITDRMFGGENERCALAVLLEVLGISPATFFFHYGFDPTYNPITNYLADKDQREIVFMNRRKSFDELADWIEENLNEPSA